MSPLKRKKKSIVPRLDFFWVAVGVILGMLILAGGYFAYHYYQSNYAEASVAKKELMELTPEPLPPHIKKALAQTATIKVPILMFHYVEYVQDKGDRVRLSLDTMPYTFEQEVKTLIDAGYTFMTASELADVLDGKTQLPKKPVLLTFDDGYRDFYTDVFPVLKKYQIKATAYIISGFLNYRNELTTEQLKEIAASGLVEIGAHTVHHAWLKKLSLEKAGTEIFQSRVTLQQITGQPVVSFAYPYGAFDDQAIQLVKDAGFRTAVSTLPGDDQSQINRYFLFRLRPGGRTGTVLLNWLDQTKF